MIRRCKDVDWPRYLALRELAFLSQQIAPDDWYPMESFELLGNAILEVIVQNNLEAVRTWGRLTVDQLWSRHPELVAEGDPVESLMRFRVLRSTFFDFDALQIPMISPGQCRVAISYYMGAVAEEAASHQAIGFFTGVLELSGATHVDANLIAKSWVDGAETLLALNWT